MNLIYEVGIYFISGMVGLIMLHTTLKNWLQKTYPKLTSAQCYVISTRIISASQAVIVSIISMRTILVCPDIIHDTDPVLETYIFLFCSYYSYDVLVMYKGFHYGLQEKKHQYKIHFFEGLKGFLKRELTVVIHHILLQCVGLPVVAFYRQGIGIFFIAGFFLAEISTPFYSIRGIMRTIGYNSGTWYELNGILFAITFFIGRVSMVPYLYYRYSIYKNIPFASVPFNIPLHCNVSSVAFLSLQLYWFYLIVRTVFRHVSKKELTIHKIDVTHLIGIVMDMTKIRVGFKKRAG